MAAALLLAACAPAAPNPAELGTAVAELAAAASQTAVALPPSPTPAPTSTPTFLVEPTLAPTPLDPTGPHPDGVYLVGASIAPGVWRSIPQHEDRFCYWARRKYDGVILGSHYGAPGGEVLIRPADYEVEFDGCGVWVYMGER